MYSMIPTSKGLEHPLHPTWPSFLKETQIPSWKALQWHGRSDCLFMVEYSLCLIKLLWPWGCYSFNSMKPLPKLWLHSDIFLLPLPLFLFSPSSWWSNAISTLPAEPKHARQALHAATGVQNCTVMNADYMDFKFVSTLKSLADSLALKLFSTFFIYNRLAFLINYKLFETGSASVFHLFLYSQISFKVLVTGKPFVDLNSYCHLISISSCHLFPISLKQGNLV